MTASLWLYSAAALAAFTLLVHVFGGGRTAAQPLLDSDLAPEPKYTNYYCWHIVTIVIGFMAVCFALPAAGLASTDLAAAAVALAALFSVWNIALWWHSGLKVVELPQWVLFLPMAVLGYLGLA
ncbi:MAG: hypothetical protein AAF515_20840 [Pseudomonadota bacterium]